ncbi:MAG: NAD-dependent epimerase/dehydratase family protein [Sphaerochaetaceae bacterium]|nr:NAD-dependent epimerase/dehydratase family protein [Sphaerochaetaceae bacterium]
MSNKVYLVTGAAGFLGGTVCRKLVNSGEKVRAFVLKNDPAMKYVPREAEIVEGDLCNLNSLEQLFRVPENSEIIVLHIASIVTVNPEYNRKVMDVNVGGTENIIALCKKYNVKKLVYCSSTGAIPELPKGNVIREISHFSAEGLKDCYSQSKALATQLVLDAAKSGLDASVVHPTGILGPEDFSVSETTKTVIDIINGKMPAGIDGSFNLSDVRDLADGLIAASEKGRKGECYILGNEVVSFRDFSRILVNQAHCKKIRFFLPIKMAYTMADVLEKRAKKTGKKPLLTKFSIWNLARNNVFDYSKAQKELGYNPRSYEETVSDEIAWLKKTGKIV